ncbi:MAG TPA: hypothetical protein VF950_24390 [Planctomycetota bacterium]
MLQLFAVLALVQDEPIELKWTAEKGDKFEIKWTYDEVSSRVPGQGEKSELTDKRVVEAEMTPREEPNRFDVALKKVSWTYSNNEFNIVLVWAAGPKPPITTVKLKVDPKASNAGAAKTFAEQRSEQMKKLVAEGTYVLGFDPGSRETYITRNNSATRNTSIFDVLFLHSPLPSGTVSNGQTWKENLERMPFPQLVEVNNMGCKVGISGNAASVKGGFQQPINRSGGARGEVITGSFTFAREFTFARDGCLLNSKEEQLLSKKVDAKGEDADFYRENSFHNIKQAVAFKKLAPPKPKEPVPPKK